jgi:hypothetical protein
MKIRHLVSHLLDASINLDNGAGVRELIRFQEHFREYKVVVYEIKLCIIFEGQVESFKRLNLLYDDVTH